MFLKKFWEGRTVTVASKGKFLAHNLIVAVLQSMQRLEEAAPPRGQCLDVILLLLCFLYRIKYLVHPKRKVCKKKISSAFHLEIFEVLEREQIMWTQKA